MKSYSIVPAIAIQRRCELNEDMSEGEIVVERDGELACEGDSDIWQDEGNARSSRWREKLVDSALDRVLDQM